MSADRTQDERMDFLLEWLCRDSGEYPHSRLPEDRKKRRDLLRSFMNIRMPGPVDKDFLTIQDQFLKQEIEEKGIVSADSLKTVGQVLGCERGELNRMVLWQGDITTLTADAIVNAANSQLLGCFIPCHGCIDNAIHSAAGVQLREECRRLIEAQGCEEPPGRAKLTKAYNLPCKHVLHTVGPIIRGPLTNEACGLLASCYRECLTLAAGKKLKSIAFCCISTGEFHFPPERAAEIAVDTVRHFLRKDNRLEKVIFNVFKAEDYRIYEELFQKISLDLR